MGSLIRIDGGDMEPIQSFSIRPGETLGEVAARLGVEITETPLPELPYDLVRQAKLNERVALLLSEYDCWDDLPSPTHEADECIECDARRIADRLLD